MSETLEELRRLQAVELELAELRRTRESKLRRIEAKARLFKKIEDQFETNQKLARERQMRIDALALEVASREDSIAKHRQALNKAKTNKEYASILAAMNTEKADNAKVEAAMLDLMKELESVKHQSDSIATEKAKFLADVEKASEALKVLDHESDRERNRLEADRAAFVERIPPSILETFSRAVQRHDGEAMAAVVKVRPRHPDYTCTGCNMKVTLEVINALQQERDEIQICGSCGRILYLENSVASRS